MQTNLIQGEAKSIVLENGVELPYCERGEEHDEIVVFTGFFFHTFMPIVEGLAKRYHVYGLVMRFDGAAEEFNEDGSVNWTRQWGRDEYEFCQKMGIEKFIHFGKCHGSVPGWYMAKGHPEMLTALASFFLAPHVKGQDDTKWFSLMTPEHVQDMFAIAMRKPESGVPKKMVEAKALNGNVGGPEIQENASCSERVWDSVEECADALRNISVPVGYLFGLDDVLYDDFATSNQWAIRNTKGARTVLLNGERHLMEIDCPERIVDEAFAFIDAVHAGYFDEIL